MSFAPIADQCVDHLVRRPRLVMLDRDGVINADSADYIKSLSEWRPIEGALDSIALLTANGFLVSLCTNQSGIARGYFNRDALDSIHEALCDSLAERNSVLAAISFCPHGPDDGCRCRKPQPGMLLEQLEALDINAQDALFVGDSLRDLEAARAARVATALVRTGNGRRTEAILKERWMTELTNLQTPPLALPQVPRQTVAVFDSLKDLAKALIQVPPRNLR